MSEVTGKCLCGQITVSVDKEAFNGPNNVAVCHCKNCRQSSGAVSSINVIVPESAVKISGQPKIYEDKNTDSGNMLQRAFCGNCGSPIYSLPPTMGGVKVIKLGIFDEIPKPSMELYCKRTLAWEHPLEGTKQFNEMPTQ